MHVVDIIVRRFESFYFIESWTSSPPRPPSPAQSQTSLTLSCKHTNNIFFNYNSFYILNIFINFQFNYFFFEFGDNILSLFTFVYQFNFLYFFFVKLFFFKTKMFASEMLMGTYILLQLIFLVI